MKYILSAAIVATVWLFSSESLVAQQYRLEREMENMLVDAVGAFEDGNLSTAKAILRTLTSQDPNNDAAHYYMGLTALAQNDEEVAEMSLLRAVELDSTNFWYRHRLAYLYGITNRQEQMVEIYNGLLRDWPKRSELYYDLIGVYVTLGRLDDALDTIAQIETLSGVSEASVMARFQILCRLDRTDEAYEVLEDYNRTYSSPQVLTILGDYNMSMYKDSLALANYDEALDIMPGYEPALIGKAETLRATRRYPEYFSTLNQIAINADIDAEDKCDYIRALLQRLDSNFLKNFQDELDGVIGNCLEAHPADSSVVDLAGVYYYSTLRDEEARKYFKQNVDNYPDALRPAYNYAEAIMYMGDLEELASFAKEAFERFPTQYNFLEMEIYANYNLNDYKKVADTCERIIRTTDDPSAALRAYSTLGDVHHLLGDSKNAYEAYENALKINPLYLPVLNNYAYYLSLEGKKLKKAAEMSAKTIDAEPDNATYLDTYAWILHLLGRSDEAKPYFKHAMLYGGKDSAVVMDHYADVLFALGEYDLAFLYWNQALAKDSEGEIEGLSEKIQKRRAEVNGKK
ncbi:MAG: tetratricopeptide repeat protein [Bacteroidales bacterium]|nr:tetratricopeptide repeat protein [Bacteroidales bacterium]